MTLEDPVEYPMTLIRQTSVSEAAKLDFANGIRAMMRQDPDVILVGEIRDQDTAEMAFRAAMTGHQVYSTLHTNSAVGAFPRLLDIGIVPGHPGRQHHRHHRPAPGAHACAAPAVSPTTRTRGTRRLLGLSPDRAGRDLPRGGLREVRVPGLPRPPEHPRAAQDRRRASTS